MANPRARHAYAYRKAMVEPVFSFMRGVMNLQRFRRRGLKKVRVEFNLHAAAYNLGRILAAQRAHSWLRALCAVATWAMAQLHIRRQRFFIGAAPMTMHRAI